MTETVKPPIARGPLVEWHLAAGATIEAVDGWEVCTAYPAEPDEGTNVLVDVSHRRVLELNGPVTGDRVEELAGGEVEVGRHTAIGRTTCYRLTVDRAILAGDIDLPEAIDVTGGWAGLLLAGPDAAGLLSKVVALDLRPDRFPAGCCAQAPLFGVNTLIGRFAGHWELAACPDSAEFLWEVLLEAGAEFGLVPAGTRWLEVHAGEGRR